MQLFVLLFTLFMPFLQPLAQLGANKMQEKMGLPPQQSQRAMEQPMMQPAAQWPQPQPRIVYHNGQWWKYENDQWYVWSQNVSASANSAFSVRR